MAKKFVIIFLVLFIILGAIITKEANAEEVGLSISDPIFDIDLLPGVEHQGSIKVFNRNKSAPLPIKISLSLWDLKPDSDDIDFVTAEPALNATKWFEFDNTSYILNPFEEKKIGFKIKPPKEAVPKTYLVVARFEPVLPSFYFSETGSKIIPELDSLFFLRVKSLTLEGGAMDYEAELVSLELVSKNKASRSLASFLVQKANAGAFSDALEKVIARITNNGRYHFKSNGYIEVKNWYGGLVTKVELPPRYVLPGRSRNVEIEILKGVSRDKESVISRFFGYIYDLLLANSYVGPYTATLVLINPVSELPLITQAFGFWVIPWKFWLLTFVIFGGLIYIATKFRERITRAVRVLVSGRLRR